MTDGDDAAPVADTGSTPWPARLQAWLVPPLPPDLEEPLAREIADRNRLRLLVVAPFVLLGHAIHVAIYRTSAVDRTSLPPQVTGWRDAVATVHAATFVVTLTLTFLLLRYGRGLTAASDVYAMGVLLFLLLTGKHPFEQGRTMHGLVFSHL